MIKETSRMNVSNLIWNDVSEPRENEHWPANLSASHHDVDFVDDLLQIGIIILKLLTSDNMPKSIQNGHI